MWAGAQLVALHDIWGVGVVFLAGQLLGFAQGSAFAALEGSLHASPWVDMGCATGVPFATATTQQTTDNRSQTPTTTCMHPQFFWQVAQSFFSVLNETVENGPWARQES